MHFIKQPTILVLEQLIMQKDLGVLSYVDDEPDCEVCAANDASSHYQVFLVHYF